MDLRFFFVLCVFLWILNVVSSSSSSSFYGETSTLPVECLYLTRQADHQVVVYRDVPNPKHPAALKLESGTDITAFSTHFLPTGIAIDGDTIYVASYGNKNLKSKVSSLKKKKEKNKPCLLKKPSLGDNLLAIKPFILLLLPIVE
jgi:hypothetical protein